MEEIKKYSLWFVSFGAAYNTLFDLISRLSEKYFSPKFELHVALLEVVRSR